MRFIYLFPARTSDVIQIAAVHIGDQFMKYVLPHSSESISKEAAAVTSISLIDSQLFHHGLAVQATSIHVPLIDFIEFLESLTDMTNQYLLATMQSTLTAGCYSMH